MLEPCSEESYVDPSGDPAILIILLAAHILNTTESFGWGLRLRTARFAEHPLSPWQGQHAHRGHPERRAQDAVQRSLLRGLGSMVWYSIVYDGIL